MGLCLVVSLLAVSVPLTSEPAGIPDDWIAYQTLARNTSVLKELGLTEDQQLRIKDAYDKARQHRLEELTRNRGLTTVERAEAALVRVRGESRDSEKLLTELLKPAQLKRLKQIHIQVLGALVFESSRYVEVLNLTAEQKDKIDGLKIEEEKARAEVTAKRRAADITSDDAFAQIEELEKARTRKMIEMLDAKQKKVWAELTGAPFEYKRDPLRIPVPAN
jgi:Spy/CpxP family protein refolding chaperone